MTNFAVINNIMIKDNIHISYILASEQDKMWGMTINTVGYRQVERDAPYPPSYRPTRYLFSPHKGRILNEYCLVYITGGKGVFRSRHHAETKVKEGTMFMLFPNEWHTYSPDPEIGWNEFWIGFEGATIDNRIKKNFFNVREPLFNIGVKEDIIALYQSAISAAQNQIFGYQQLLAGIVNHMLSIIYSRNRQNDFERIHINTCIDKAKAIMRENLNHDISMEKIAGKINMNYTLFRRHFREYTGFTPVHYMQELRLRKSKELLVNTCMTSQEIAFDAGFDNVSYFCTLFKRTQGITPLQYRNNNR
jgi:AraC-like DNA-binding protein